MKAIQNETCNESNKFAVPIAQNGELVDLRPVYVAGQELRKSIGSAGDKVSGAFIMRDGKQVNQCFVSRQAASQLALVLEKLKYVLHEQGLAAHFIELSMFDPSDPYLKAFFFALYSDSSHFIRSYLTEMKQNIVLEHKGDARGILVPNPLLYAFPVIGLKHANGSTYRSTLKQSLFLGVFPGSLPGKSRDDKYGRAILAEVEKKAVNFMDTVLKKLESRRGGASSVNTALLVTFPRPAGNGRITDTKLKLRGGSLFAYGDSKALTGACLERSGLIVSSILSRSVLAISQSQIEFQTNQQNMLRLFGHDASKPLFIIRDNYLQALKQNVDGEYDADLVRNCCRRIEDQIDFAMANFHAYGFASGARVRWEPRRVLIEPIVRTVLRVVMADAGEMLMNVRIDPIECNLDSQKYMAMLYCLLDNGIKAVKKKKDAKISVSVKKRGRRFITTVKDNGIGIDKDDQAKLGLSEFSKFGSSGLGLKIVNGFLELANGYKVIKSVKGRGTSVSFNLPLE